MATTAESVKTSPKKENGGFFGRLFGAKETKSEVQSAAEKDLPELIKRGARHRYKDPELKELLKKVNAGDVKAIYDLASTCYLNGGNNKIGAYWCRKAADGGHAEAQYQMGEFHQSKEPSGECSSCKAGNPCSDAQAYGVTHDLKTAAEWWEKAARQGHAEAQRYISSYYYHNLKDKQACIDWCKKIIAQQGRSLPTAYAAEHREEGYMIKRRLESAQKWLTNAERELAAEAKLAAEKAATTPVPVSPVMSPATNGTIVSVPGNHSAVTTVSVVSIAPSKGDALPKPADSLTPAPLKPISVPTVVSPAPHSPVLENKGLSELHTQPVVQQPLDLSAQPVQQMMSLNAQLSAELERAKERDAQYQQALAASSALHNVAENLLAVADASKDVLSAASDRKEQDEARAQWQLIQTKAQTREYYDIFRRKFNALLVAYQTIYSDLVKNSQVTKAGFVAGAFAKLAPHVPGGGILLEILGDGAKIIDYREKQKNTNGAASFLPDTLSVSITGEGLARLLAREQQDALLALPTGPSNKVIKAIKQVIDKAFVNDIDTPAKELAFKHCKAILKSILSGQVIANADPRGHIFPEELFKLAGVVLGAGYTPKPMTMVVASETGPKRNAASPMPVSLKPEPSPSPTDVASAAELAEMKRKMEEERKRRVEQERKHAEDMAAVRRDLAKVKEAASRNGSAGSTGGQDLAVAYPDAMGLGDGSMLLFSQQLAAAELQISKLTAAMMSNGALSTTDDDVLPDPLVPGFKGRSREAVSPTTCAQEVAAAKDSTARQRLLNVNGIL